MRLFSENRPERWSAVCCLRTFPICFVPTYECRKRIACSKTKRKKTKSNWHIYVSVCVYTSIIRKNIYINPKRENNCLRNRFRFKFRASCERTRTLTCIIFFIFIYIYINIFQYQNPTGAIIFSINSLEIPFYCAAVKSI